MLCSQSWRKGIESGRNEATELTDCLPILKCEEKKCLLLAPRRLS